LEYGRWLHDVEPEHIPEANVAPGSRVSGRFLPLTWNDELDMFCPSDVGCQLPPELASQAAAANVPRRTGATPAQGPESNAELSDIDGLDPVNPATGEFIIEEVDLAFPGLGQLGFEHRRVYRSAVAYRGPMGHGWDHGYNQRLHV